MEVFTIYHIPGIKVGATNNLKRRTWANKREYGKDIITEVLQITTSIEMADEKENEYSIHLGYGPIPSNERYLVRNRVGKHREGAIASAETREKLRQAKIGKKASKETKAILRKTNSGKNNGNYGNRRGILLKELTTGFTGTRTDMELKFGVRSDTVSAYAKRNRPLKKGKHKGLHFVIVDPTSL